MKHAKWCFLILTGFLLLLTGCGNQPPGKEPLAVVDKIEKGEALVKRASDKDFGQVQAKAPLFEGDIIKTSEKAEAVLMFSTGAVARVLPNSQFEIKPPQMVQTSMKVIYTRLIDGVATFYVPKGNEGAKKFEVETERAVASIKGTAFKLEHRLAKTTLTVLEGEVGFKFKGTPKKLLEMKRADSADKGKAETAGEILVGAFQRSIASEDGFSDTEKVNALEDPDLSEVDKIIKLSH